MNLFPFANQDRPAVGWSAGLVICFLLVLSPALGQAQTALENELSVSGEGPDEKDPSLDEKESSGSPPSSEELPPDPDGEIKFEDWIEMEPTGANAKFKMPVKPRYIERSFSPIQDQPAIKVHLWQATYNKGKVLFSFGYHDFNQTPAKDKIEDTLDGAVRGSFVNVSGKLLEHGKIRYGDYPGRAFIYIYAHSEKIYKVYERVLLFDNRQYQIRMIMLQDDFNLKAAEQFLDTFRIVEPEKEEIDSPLVPQDLNKMKPE